MTTFDARGLPPRFPLDPDLEIAPADLAKALATDPSRVTIIDVRNAPEVAFASLPRSIHIPLEDVPVKGPRLDIPEDHLVAVLCHHGRRSIPGALALREAGFPAARSIAGGLDLWSQSIDPAVPRYKRDGMKVWPA